MGFYDEMQAVATDLLSGEFKQGIITYSKTNVGNGPVDNPGTLPPTLFELKGGTASGVSKKYVDSGLAVATDLQVVAPVDPRYSPNMKDNILLDGVSHKILGWDQKPAVGVPVVFIFVVRRGPK